MKKKQKLINFIEENIEDGDSLILFGYILTQNKKIIQKIVIPEKNLIKEYIESEYNDDLFMINSEDEIEINS
jgi:hypothetical protein